MGQWNCIRLAAGDGPIHVFTTLLFYRLESPLELESLMRAYFEACFIACFIASIIAYLSACLREPPLGAAVERAMLLEE